MHFDRKYELSSFVLLLLDSIHMHFDRKYELSSFVLLLLDSTYAF